MNVGVSPSRINDGYQGKAVDACADFGKTCSADERDEEHAPIRLLSTVTERAFFVTL